MRDFLYTVKGEAKSFEGLRHQPGDTSDHHSDLYAAKYDWGVAKSVKVGFSIAVAQAHVTVFLRRLIAGLWVVLIPQVEGAKVAISVVHSFFKLWDDARFDEVRVLESRLLLLDNFHVKMVDNRDYRLLLGLLNSWVQQSSLHQPVFIELGLREKGL